MARRWNLRGTTLFSAFLLNSLVYALVATAIVETRLALDVVASAPLLTFMVGFLLTFAVCNIMYLGLSYGSSLTATRYTVPYW